MKNDYNKERMQRRALGKRLADQLQPVQTAVAVGKQLNLSSRMVQNIEQEALYKVLQAFRKVTD